MSDETQLQVVPGLKVLLTNPYELVLTDSRGSAVVLRDDDPHRPRAPKLYELLRRQSFTRADLIEALDGDGASILGVLTEQAIVVEDLAQVRLGGVRRIPITMSGDEALTKRLSDEFGEALDVRPGLEGAEIAVYAGPVDTKALEALNGEALAKRVAVLPLMLLSSRSALVGPYVTPGRSACLRELLLWMMNADLIPQADPTQMVGNVASFDSGSALPYLPLETLAIGFLMEMLVEHGCAKASDRLSSYSGRALFIDLERRLVTLESVLRIPGCTSCQSLLNATYSEEAVPHVLLAERA